MVYQKIFYILFFFLPVFYTRPGEVHANFDAMLTHHIDNPSKTEEMRKEYETKGYTTFPLITSQRKDTIFDYTKSFVVLSIVISNGTNNPQYQVIQKGKTYFLKTLNLQSTDEMKDRVFDLQWETGGYRLLFTAEQIKFEKNNPIKQVVTISEPIQSKPLRIKIPTRALEKKVTPKRTKKVQNKQEQTATRLTITPQSTDSNKTPNKPHDIWYYLSLINPLTWLRFAFNFTKRIFFI